MTDKYWVVAGEENEVRGEWQTAEELKADKTFIDKIKVLCDFDAKFGAPIFQGFRRKTPIGYIMGDGQVKMQED
jgi:hypothetical protein